MWVILYTYFGGSCEQIRDELLLLDDDHGEIEMLDFEGVLRRVEVGLLHAAIEGGIFGENGISLQLGPH